MSDNHATRRVRIWDLPLRLFHWLLLAAVVVAFLTIWMHGSMDVHMYAGYTVLALVLFRIVWGFVGGEHARFTSFIKGPSAIKAYFSNPASTGPGHNPLGALSVVGLLLVLLIQSVSGLFNFDDELDTGPLRKLISDGLADVLHELHEANQTILLGLIGLHLAAILFYRFVKRDNLIKPMITGSKEVPAVSAAQDAKGGNAILGIVLMLLIFAGVCALVKLV